MSNTHAYITFHRQVLATAVLCALLPLTAQALTLPVSQDATISSAKPLAASGFTPKLSVDAKHKAVLSFSYAALPNGIIGGQVAKATLRLWVNLKKGLETDALELHTLPVGWTEQLVSSATIPATGSLITSESLSAISAGHWLEVDVTTVVKDYLDNQSPANPAILIQPAAGSSPKVSVSFDSKENTATSHTASIDLELVALAAVGAKGDTGATGAPGAKGDKGDKGDIGPQGLPGNPGTSATVNHDNSLVGDGSGTPLQLADPLTRKIFDATDQYNQNGQRILIAPGLGNIFAGMDAGKANPTGLGNSFYGESSGTNTTTGSANTFMGRVSGRNNTTGAGNVFFGQSAGESNTTGDTNTFSGYNSGIFTTTGGRNTFMGASAGDTNTTGNNNSAFGYKAGPGPATDSATTNLSFATAIGAEAEVSTSNTIALGRSLGQDQVLIPGNLVVNGTITDSNSMTGKIIYPVVNDSLIPLLPFATASLSSSCPASNPNLIGGGCKVDSIGYVIQHSAPSATAPSTTWICTITNVSNIVTSTYIPSSLTLICAK